MTKATPSARAYRVAAGAATIGPAGGLTPSDLASAYNFSPAATGAGQTVAIVDAGDDPTIESDLNTFDTQYGLPACTIANGCLRKFNQSGGTSPLPSDQGWSLEIALDVESVHSVCQNCVIDLIETNDNLDVDLEAGVNAAVALGATEISNSYGGAANFTPSAADLAAYNHPGVVITASSGDDGYYAFDLWIKTPIGGPAGNTGVASFPASLATVVSVGGTSLYLNQSGTYQSQTVWNDDGPSDKTEQIYGARLGASASGCSPFVTAPMWQQTLANWAQSACGTSRLDNDVSVVADPYTGFDIYNTTDSPTGWITMGGTSLSSPVVAAMYALAGGAQGVPYPALTLYAHLSTKSLYDDVTVGGTGFCGGEGAAQCGNPNDYEANGVALGVMDCDFPATGSTPAVGDLACDAGVGYDGASGVGSPNGLGAFVKVHPTVTISGPKSAVHGSSSVWTATGKDTLPGSVIASYTWKWGDKTPNTVTTTGSASHTFATAGAHKETVVVTDSYGVTGTATYPVSVG